MTQAVARRIRSSAYRRVARPLLALGMCSTLLGFFGCSQTQPDPGSVRFLVRTTPAPDDAVLSPLRDLRVTALELRDGRTDDLPWSARSSASVRLERMRKDAERTTVIVTVAVLVMLVIAMSMLTMVPVAATMRVVLVRVVGVGIILRGQPHELESANLCRRTVG